MMFEILAVIASFFVGFAMKRGGLCTYAAVTQVIHDNSYERSKVFLGAAAWATLIIVPFSWFWPEIVKLSLNHQFFVTALLGGIVIGFGAFLNKGCIFGTFVQLVGGNLTYVATLLGMSASIVLTHFYYNDLVAKKTDAAVTFTPNTTAYFWLFIVTVFAIYALFEKNHQQQSVTTKSTSVCMRNKPSILYMLIIGIGGGLLYAGVSGWDYASVLIETTYTLFDDQAIGPTELTIKCTIAMVTGGVLAAITEGSFTIQAPKLLQSLTSFIGGGLMGAAAIIAPGGNDGMLLRDIPSLSPNGILSFIFMVVTMLLLVYLFKRLNRC